MKRFMKSLAAASIAVAGLTVAADAAPVVYQPTEAESTDVFVYEFIQMVDFNSGGWEAMLPTVKTGTGHDLYSLLKFDLVAGGITLDPDERAELRLYVDDIAASGFTELNPEPGKANPTVDFFLNTGDFTESAKWATRPPTAATPFASIVVDDVNKWVSIDITDQVAAWLADPSTNFGISIIQRDVVVRDGGKVGVLFHGAGGANGPTLVVPEPASIGLLVAGSLGFLACRRRVV